MPPITGTATTGTTEVTRLALLAFALVAGALQLDNLRAHLGFDHLYTLESQLREGRFEPTDLDRLAPLATARVQRPYACRAKRGLAMVKLYLVDLTAAQAGRDPFAPSDAPDMVVARSRAAGALRAALRCAPLDGDLWLRLAVLEHGQGASRPRIARLVARSRAVTPHEGYLERRRRALAPMLGASAERP